METFAEKIISFCRDLDFKGQLPQGISVMNPYRTSPLVFETVSEFYIKYFNDSRSRHLILGINPGRFGAGATGIPFTDTVRLKEKCGLTIAGLRTYETSSVFVYEMIDKYGGPEKFYSDFYISSVSPLGLVYKKPDGKEINCNYYDSRELTDAIFDFAADNIRKQIDFGITRDVCFCLGTGKNFRFLSVLNSEYRLFDRIEPLEHPRFIMQYRSKSKEAYINKYLGKFKKE
jgi:hypothetical protein